MPRERSIPVNAAPAPPGVFDPFAVKKNPFTDRIKKDRRKQAKKYTTKEREENKFHVAIKHDAQSRRYLNRGNAFKKPFTKKITKVVNGETVEKTIPFGNPALRKAQWKRLVKSIAQQYNDGVSMRINQDIQERIGNDVIAVRLSREIFPDAQQRRIDSAPHPTREEVDKHFLIDTISSRHLESAVRMNLVFHQKNNPGSIALQVFEDTLAEMRDETNALNVEASARASEKSLIQSHLEVIKKKYADLAAGRITDKSEKIHVYNCVKEYCELRASREDRNKEALEEKENHFRDQIKTIRKKLIPTAEDTIKTLRGRIEMEEDKEVSAKDAVLLGKAEKYLANRIKDVGEIGLRIAKIEDKIKATLSDRDGYKKAGKNAVKHLKTLESN